MGKRANGEGTIRKRSEGRWEARLVQADGTRRSLYGKTQQEASRLLAQARREREQGIVPPTDRQTVAGFLLTWLETVKRHTVGPSSYVRARQDVRVHLAPGLGHHQLARLTPQQVQALYARMLADGYAPATVRHVHITLHDALSHAVKLGQAPRNVVDLATPPRREQSEMAILTEEQVRALLQAVRGDRLEALLMLALATGMREGELVALRWQDVDLGVGTVQVLRTLKSTPEGRAFGKAKSARSRRVIALPAAATAALTGHRTAQLEERRWLGEAWEENDLVFCNEGGGRLSHHTFDRRRQTSWYCRQLVRAGIPSVRFHDLRHTAATLLLAQGVNVKVVSEMLGHSSVAITLTLYGHVLPHMQRDAAAAMDRLLGGGQAKA
jgi:integrase